MTLKGPNIGLRALEPEDISFLYTLENNPALWELSETIEPYSKNILQNYLKHASEGIAEARQLRLLVYEQGSARSLGFLDFYDYEQLHSRVGVGIVILEDRDRGRGFGREALVLALGYAFEVLKVHQVFAHIMDDNLASVRLFESVGFGKSGVRKDWIRTSKGYKNQLIYQKFHYEEP